MFARQQTEFPRRAAPSPTRELAAQARSVLNALRMIALECRSEAKANTFEACAVLSTSKTVAKDAHARVLMRCLGHVLRARPVLYRPGTVALSFDEAWLMRAVLACRDQDWGSFEFLLRSRVPHEQRRTMAFLIHGISDRFGQF